jgi:membrane associated rhomboid family serine protease
MNGRPSASLAFPKPGPALTAVLVVVGVTGIVTALVGAWSPAGLAVFPWLAFQPDQPLPFAWRWLTSGVLTSPESWSHLFFSLLGLYFLGVPLERRWGTWRLVRFLGIAVFAGNLLTYAIGRAMPLTAPERFHPALVFGPSAAIAAIAIAWSREYADSTVQLFFVLPVRGIALFWVTIGFCVLDLIYPQAPPEGVVAPFGGLVVGLLFGGSPSLFRSVWLRVRLALLRRQARGAASREVLALKPSRRRSSSSPPLRVVSGGLEDVLRKRNPPKDKRYLN